MSEERFDRIEAQIAELRELMQQNIAATQQEMTAIKQNMNATREDIGSLRQRVDSIEGTVVITIREGFNSFRNYIDDLNYDLAETERKVSDNDRKHRRLNRRVARLERKEGED